MFAVIQGVVKVTLGMLLLLFLVSLEKITVLCLSLPIAFGTTQLQRGKLLFCLYRGQCNMSRQSNVTSFPKFFCPHFTIVQLSPESHDRTGREEVGSIIVEIDNVWGRPGSGWSRKFCSVSLRAVYEEQGF